MRDKADDPPYIPGKLPKPEDLKGFVDDDIIELHEKCGFPMTFLIDLMNIRVNLELIELFKEMKERANEVK